MKRAVARSNPLPHPLTPYPDLIVNFCPTGMVPTKAMTPHELATNEGLVQRVANISETFGRPLANCARARTRLGLGRSAARAEPAAIGVFES